MDKIYSLVKQKRFWNMVLLCACSLMIISFVLPWWQATSIEYKAYILQGGETPDVSFKIYSGSLTDAITIYGYGLKHQLVELEPYIYSDKTPLYQSILAWVYIVAGVFAALISTRMERIKGARLLLCVGLCYMAYAAISVLGVISPRLHSLGFAPQGSTTAYISNAVVTMQAKITVGYYLAYIAGMVFVILAITRFFFDKSTAC
jgi:hypothetical protein